jgi:hypothetical protein
MQQSTVRQSVSQITDVICHQDSFEAAWGVHACGTKRVLLFGARAGMLQHDELNYFRMSSVLEHDMFENMASCFEASSDANQETSFRM